MIIHEEKIEGNFVGTIIDLETIGNFDNYYDSRRYRNIIPVIFGFVNSNVLKIFCAKSKNSIQLLKNKIEELLPQLNRPFHAFNCDFERGVLFHFCGKETLFDAELDDRKFEKKEEVVESLKISKYGDPFNGNGFLCSQAWSNGKLKEAIAHNRSCLLKERDILKLRGMRNPDILKFIP
ncbi:MAG: hypothetical protein KKB21_02535 [Nanoarchaeota archaeon]|nr:hypothetical protein [Nanoarchaeota archaeon]MBU4086433.1 hypothetical protein [Nanoarchaeota archaeon]